MIPELEPVWATAAELGASFSSILSPVAGAPDRLRPTSHQSDRPIRSTPPLPRPCLTFSGVLERYPTLKFCLAHGAVCPYQAGRFVHAGSSSGTQEEARQAAD